MTAMKRNKGESKAKVSKLKKMSNRRFMGVWCILYRKDWIGSIECSMMFLFYGMNDNAFFEFFAKV